MREREEMGDRKRKRERKLRDGGKRSNRDIVKNLSVWKSEK